VSAAAAFRGVSVHRLDVRVQEDLDRAFAAARKVQHLGQSGTERHMTWPAHVRVEIRRGPQEPTEGP
jgi:hypothetical protein